MENGIVGSRPSKFRIWPICECFADARFESNVDGWSAIGEKHNFALSQFESGNLVGAGGGMTTSSSL
jgi:hypothetical protein